MAIVKKYIYTLKITWLNPPVLRGECKVKISGTNVLEDSYFSSGAFKDSVMIMINKNFTIYFLLLYVWNSILFSIILISMNCITKKEKKCFLLWIYYSIIFCFCILDFHDTKSRRKPITYICETQLIHKHIMYMK